MPPLFVIINKDNKLAHLDALGVYWPDTPHETLIVSGFREGIEDMANRLNKENGELGRALSNQGLRVAIYTHFYTPEGNHNDDEN